MISTNQRIRLSYVYNDRDRFKKKCGLKVYLLLTLIAFASSISDYRPHSKWTGSNTNLHKSTSNSYQDRYASLPPTVFSPDGRLYNVEHAAQQASDMQDRSSSLVLAFTFGSKEEECIMVLSSSTMSSHLYRAFSHDDAFTRSTKPSRENYSSREDENVDDRDADSSEKKSLFRNGAPLYVEGIGVESRVTSQPTIPLAMVSSNILIGTGGSAAETNVFNRRIRKLALSLHRSNDKICDIGIEPGQTQVRSFHSASLAKKVADVVQNPTQSVGGSNGKILASAAMIIGGNELQSTLSKVDSAVLTHNIWRIDPTGQFWKCHAAAVGKGAGNAEAMFLKQVEKWKKAEQTEPKHRGFDYKNANIDQSQHMESLVNHLTNKDVEKYFRTLSFDEAMVLACRCCASALKISNNQSLHPNFVNEIGIQALIIRKTDKQEAVFHETIHSDIIKKAMSLALDD